MPEMPTSEKEAKEIIRDYYATYYPGLEHVYPEALKEQVEFVYNRLVKEGKLEECLQQYKTLTFQRKKEKGLIKKNQ
jgi:hypothetical protein